MSRLDPTQNRKRMEEVGKRLRLEGELEKENALLKEKLTALLKGINLEAGETDGVSEFVWDAFIDAGEYLGLIKEDGTEIEPSYTWIGDKAQKAAT